MLIAEQERLKEVKVISVTVSLTLNLRVMTVISSLQETTIH